MNGEAITAEEIRARRQAVELAKRLLVDSIWRIANIEVSDITYPEAEEIVDGRAPAGMAVDAIVAVNNIKHAWELLLDHVDRPVDWRYVCEYNRILGAGLAWDAGRIREHGVIVGGTQWTLPIPTDESSRERIREIMQESAGGGLLLFGAIARGQWFCDGNKRTALMVANHQLIHDGIGIISIPPKARSLFMTMLLRYYETNDVKPLDRWLSYNVVGRVPGGLTAAMLHDVASRK